MIWKFFYSSELGWVGFHGVGNSFEEFGFNSVVFVCLWRLRNNIFCFLCKFNAELPIFCCALDDFIQFELAVKLAELEPEWSDPY